MLYEIYSGNIVTENVKSVLILILFHSKLLSNKLNFQDKEFTET
jgi:hypothetical protein